MLLINNKIPAIDKTKNNKISKAFIYNILNSQFIQKLIDAYASGTTILHAGSAVKKMKFILPTEDILERYNQTEMKKFNLILNLLDQVSFLKESRNIILPRLMLGIIKVEEIIS